MLCKIWGFHLADYEEWRPLVCDAAWLLKEARFGRTYSLHHQDEKISQLGTLAVTSN
jgi:hypothetical protein